MADNLTTQQFVEVEAIENNTVILKNGGLRQIVMVGGLNFELKAEQEQQLILYSFQNFLDSLDFSLQIFVHSRRLNVEKYLRKLNEYEQKEGNETLKNQIVEYQQFIKSFVAENAIMNKTFFAVVPFNPTSLKAAGKGLIGMFKSKKPNKTEGEELRQSREEYVSQLNQRTEQVVNGLNRVGLRSVQLNDEELTELFYNLYNPEAVEKAELEIAKEQG